MATSAKTTSWGRRTRTAAPPGTFASAPASATWPAVRTMPGATSMPLPRSPPAAISARKAEALTRSHVPLVRSRGDERALPCLVDQVERELEGLGRLRDGGAVAATLGTYAEDGEGQLAAALGRLLGGDLELEVDRFGAKADLGVGAAGHRRHQLGTKLLDIVRQPNFGDHP